MSVGSEDEISVGLEYYVENNTRLCIIFLVFIIFEYIIEHFLHEFFGVIKGDKNERKRIAVSTLFGRRGRFTSLFVISETQLYQNASSDHIYYTSTVSERNLFVFSLFHCKRT